MSDAAADTFLGGTPPTRDDVQEEIKRAEMKYVRDARDRFPGVLPDHQIRRFVGIKPYERGINRPGVVSYGETSYGYDARLGYKFKVCCDTRRVTRDGSPGVIDPKNFDPWCFMDVDITPARCAWRKVFTSMRDPVYWECGWCGGRSEGQADPTPRTCPKSVEKEGWNRLWIPAHSFALGETVEEFDIPRGIIAICLGKSTYARCGVIANVTPLEPEWRGKVTIEISNSTPLPAAVYAGEGIIQVIFLRAADVCEVSYADKKGRYQDQKGLTTPFVGDAQRKE